MIKLKDYLIEHHKEKIDLRANVDEYGIVTFYLHASGGSEIDFIVTDDKLMWVSSTIHSSCRSIAKDLTNKPAPSEEHCFHPKRGEIYPNIVCCKCGLVCRYSKLDADKCKSI